MLFVSEDKARFICTTEEGAPCFMRGTHTKLAKESGLELDKMENLTFAFYVNGNGQSIKNFLNSQK